MPNLKVIFHNVIIYGDCWPVVSAVQYVVRAIRPECQCDVAGSLLTLLQCLIQTPEATLILCLRPREHIYLFYALKQTLLSHPALVISDELLFSDRVVLHSWGGIPAVLHQELAGMIARLRMGEKLLYPPRGSLADFLAAPKPATGLFAVPLIFNQPKRLMNYMELLMCRAAVSCGVTSGQLRLLQEAYTGKCTLSGLTNKLNKNKKQIWQDKNRLLIKLGMRNRMRELLSGTRFCESQQRTAFISPVDVEAVPDSVVRHEAVPVIVSASK